MTVSVFIRPSFQGSFDGSNASCQGVACPIHGAHDIVKLLAQVFVPSMWSKTYTIRSKSQIHLGLALQLLKLGLLRVQALIAGVKLFDEAGAQGL